MIFDTHAHYYDDAFDADRDALLSSLPERGVALVVCPGCDLESSRQSIALAERYPFLYAAAGYHPENLEGVTLSDVAQIRALCAHEKVVAVGEIGLDYYWKDNPPREFQQQGFHKQLDLAQELGLPVRGIFYGEEGFRHFFTVEPVSGIEDLAGMKLRVSNDPVMNGLVEGLGATPTVVSFNELYSALQTGVVDGAEQPIANYASNAFPEVANNLILDGHTLGAVQVVITDNAWAKLTANQQNVILEAGKAAQEFNAGLSEDEENRVLEELKAEGCNVVDVPDKTAWQEACAQVITDNTAGLEDLYQQLVDMA